MSFKILSILYTEFNIDKGPELVYQVPNNYIKLEDFKKISEFVVPLSKFCYKEISLHLGNSYLLGFPIFFNNQIYERNRFEFNFCLLVDEDDYENNNFLYQCLIKKIDTTFENIEIDYNFKFMKKNLPMIKKFIDLLYLEFISGKSIININIEEIDNNNNKLKIKKLENINFLEKNKSKENISNKDLPNIYFEKIKIENDLDIHSSLSSSKALPNQEEQKQNKKIINFSFKYINFNNINIEIKNHFVPIWIKKIYKEEILKLDNISILIINKINGINSVENISKEPLSIDLVKYVLYSLYLTEQITFVDLFQHSNIYKPTINLKNIKIEGLFNKFKNFYILNNINDDITNKNIDDHKLFSYYVLLSNSKNVKNFEDKAKDFEINLQLFIAFGVYLGIIRRIHLYFFIKKYANTDDIVSLMDGKHCEDDICVEKGITLEKLKKIYDENKGGDNYYFLYK
jgi:hypothetical protein